MRRSSILFFAVSLVAPTAAGCSFVTDFGRFTFGDGGAGSADVGSIDVGPHDGGPDVGPHDAGPSDMGASDAGHDASGDVGSDAGLDSGCMPGATDYCGSMVGECRQGTTICRADGTWGPCSGGTDPVAEICNGHDDDCDAMTDETPADTSCTYGCNMARAACNVCPIGTIQCMDTMTLQTCTDGSAWSSSTCMFGCSANMCNVCMPSVLSCMDATHDQQCNATGTGYSVTHSCGTLGCEDVIYHQCRQCDPSRPTQCSTTNANIRVDCNSSGFATGSLSCSAVYPGSAPNGCNPATGHCYHQP